jgi:hypothetical protein
MKERVLVHFDLNYAKAVMDDREREAKRLRLAREDRKARSERRKLEGEPRRRVSLRDPVRA